MAESNIHGKFVAPKTKILSLSTPTPGNKKAIIYIVAQFCSSLLDTVLACYVQFDSAQLNSVQFNRPFR